LTRAKIAAAAIEQIQESGAPTVNLRAVAAKLRVSPNAILFQLKKPPSSLEAEVVKAVLGGVARPLAPNEDAVAYLRDLFRAVGKALEDKPMVARLAIFVLLDNPLLVPRVMERLLACLATLDGATPDLPRALSRALDALLNLILMACARGERNRKSTKAGGEDAGIPLDESEYPNLARIRGAWPPRRTRAARRPSPLQAAEECVDRLLRDIGR
jgi:hypothetical protein